jgi:hypothetical protein
MLVLTQLLWRESFRERGLVLQYTPQDLLLLFIC